MSMKISYINNLSIPKLTHLDRFNHHYSQNDVVSFSGKININYEMKNLPREAFPSNGLQEFILKGIESNPSADVVELHRRYYSDLLSCKSLGEAKELYPEFQKIIDAKNLDLSKKPRNNVFWQIREGKVPNIDIENVSLIMLKKYYAELIPANVDYIKENLGFSYSAFNTLVDTLNLTMDKRYLKLLGLKMRASNMQEAWETDSMRVQRAETFKKTASSSETKQKYSTAAKKRWEDAAYRANLTLKIRENRRTPETRQKTAEITKQLWQDENYKKKMEINNKAAAMAWELHPYAKQVYQEIAHEFPELKAALECRRNNLPMTDRQARVLSQYYKTCAQRYPNLRKEVADIQKHILESWGFYDKNSSPTEILNKIQNAQQE